MCMKINFSEDMLEKLELEALVCDLKAHLL